MDELISDFLTETNESLALLDVEIVRLEQNPDDQNLLGSIFRIMHTIKGTCGFLGLPRLESVAHAGENVLGKVREGKLNVTPEIISIILESIDAIKHIVSYIEVNESEPDGSDQELINRLNIASGTKGHDHAGSGHENVDIAHTNNTSMDDMEALFAATPAITPTFAGSEGTDCLNTEQKLSTHQDPLCLEKDLSSQDQPVDKQQSTISSESVDAPEPQIAVPDQEQLITHAIKKETTAASGNSAIKIDHKEHGKNANTNQSIRVSLDVLEGLMQMVSELVLTRNQLLQMVRAHKDSEFSAPLQRLSHITSELQERVMKTRMQPIGNAWAQFPRMIRDLSLELGKKIELRMIGEDTELDRQLIESIKDPLTHMVRNSTDHGLETPEQRKAAGKKETGVVTLKAYHQGGHIIIEISDDGRGLNIGKIKQKIITNELATEAELASMSDQQIQQFIFKAGLSTAEKVTSISGRGVGMDVVKTNIEKISGTIELRSTEGKGSTFLIKIPLTLAIMSVLIVESQGEKFGIPQINVLEMLKAGKNSEYVIETINNAPVLRLRESLLPLVTLSEILGLKLDRDHSMYRTNDTFIVACEIGGCNFGVIVDKIFDTEEIVVKPVAPVLKSIDVYSGSTLLGDGSVIMILDPNGLAKATGEMSLSGDHSNARDNRVLLREENMASFVIFRSGSGAPRAVPLELVSRLEEIEVSRIELSDERKVIQYRDALMFLEQIDQNYSIPTEGVQQIIVFSDKNKILGLVVEEIIDIVEHPMNVEFSQARPGFLGAIVINGKTTDLIDLNYFFNRVFHGSGSDSEAFMARHHASFKILLIDDSPFFRKFIPPTLMQVGYHVTTADSAKKAMELLERGQRFDLIITDINMPDMNGQELARELKNNPRYSDIPVMALSSNVNEQIIQNTDHYGLVAYISKTNHEELLKTVSNICNSRQELTA
jgi:two-component system chemotaxis sensor kinase CheA